MAWSPLLVKFHHADRMKVRVMRIFAMIPDGVNGDFLHRSLNSAAAESRVWRSIVPADLEKRSPAGRPLGRICSERVRRAEVVP